LVLTLLVNWHWKLRKSIDCRPNNVVLLMCTTKMMYSRSPSSLSQPTTKGTGIWNMLSGVIFNNTWTLL
jgi:hypothetical protein